MEMKNRKLAAEIAEERMSMIAPLLSQNMDSRRGGTATTGDMRTKPDFPTNSGTVSLRIFEWRF